MSESNIVRYRPGRDPKPVGKTDWQRLRAMSDEEVEANAASDLDNQPLMEDRAFARPMLVAGNGREIAAFPMVEECRHLKRRDLEVLAVERLSDADLNTIAAAEVSDEFSHLDAELET